ncbi:hypothetical protein [Glutamicibacter creatinolyticus]|uniref:hypothetical protein n=1 Tax=Glutamicibacter creatinolyticus TaxID=162496 RepID=UPI003217DE31
MYTAIRLSLTVVLCLVASLVLPMLYARLLQPLRQQVQYGVLTGACLLVYGLLLAVQGRVLEELPRRWPAAGLVVLTATGCVLLSWYGQLSWFFGTQSFLTALVYIGFTLGALLLRRPARPLDRRATA